MVIIKFAVQLSKPKAPTKAFKWTEEIRAMYGKLIQVKTSQLKLIRIKSDDQFDLMKVSYIINDR